MNTIGRQHEAADSLSVDAHMYVYVQHVYILLCTITPFWVFLVGWVDEAAKRFLPSGVQSRMYF